MELKVIEKTIIARDTVRIRLADACGATLPAFKPGAHMAITIAGMERRYSLTSSPETLHHYEICVLRARPSRGGSDYIHDVLRVGETLTASEPNNAFPLREGAGHRECARHSVFIAGGIGITPFYSMMERLHHTGRSFELHYSARSRDRLLPVPYFVDSMRLYVGSEDQSRLDIDALLQETAPKSDLYVCGPRRMLEEVREKAAERGWRKDAIHFESFGGYFGQDDAPISLTLARSGMTLEVKPGTSILDALIANGIWAAYECRRGECGSCVTGVVAGEPDHRDVCLTAVQRKTGLCTCVSWAKSPGLTLDL